MITTNKTFYVFYACFFLFSLLKQNQYQTKSHFKFNSKELKAKHNNNNNKMNIFIANTHTHCHTYCYYVGHVWFAIDICFYMFRFYISISTWTLPHHLCVNVCQKNMDRYCCKANMSFIRKMSHNCIFMYTVLFEETKTQRHWFGAATLEF